MMLYNSRAAGSRLIYQISKFGLLRRKFHASRKSPSPSARLNLFVSCLPGLEGILSSELTDLGICSSQTITRGGVNIPATSLQGLLDCHLHLGTASHILLRCGEPFRARGFPELQRKVERINWNDMLHGDDNDRTCSILDVRVSSSKSKLYHTGAIAERVRQSIQASSVGTMNTFDDDDLQSADTSGTMDIVRLAVRVHYDMVQMSIDTSSSPLHQRGYRLQTAKAPLREDLAFALLYSGGCRSPYHQNNDLIGTSAVQKETFEGILDPFCGAGTIAIEGACMLSGLPPGRLRSAPLQGTRYYDPSRWENMITDATHRQLERAGIIVSASDRDLGACEALRSNSERAGVLDLLDIRNCALASNPWLSDPTSAPSSLLVATNPPFGKRIRSGRHQGADPNTKALLPLYQSLGKHVRSLLDTQPNVGCTILAHDRTLAHQTGLTNLEVAFSTKHGGLPVSAMVMKR